MYSRSIELGPPFTRPRPRSDSPHLSHLLIPISSSIIPHRTFSLVAPTHTQSSSSCCRLHRTSTRRTHHLLYYTFRALRYAHPPRYPLQNYFMVCVLRSCLCPSLTRFQPKSVKADGPASASVKRKRTIRSRPALSGSNPSTRRAGRGARLRVSWW